MVYRNEAVGSFECTAEMLILLLCSLEESHEDNFLKKYKEIILKILDILYGGKSFSGYPKRLIRFVLWSIIDIRRFKNILYIINFGKQNGLSKKDWLRAVE